MQSRTGKAEPLVGERFHNLVSSGVLTPFEWRDEMGERHYGYEVGENKQAVDYLDRLRRAIRRVAMSQAPPWREERIGARHGYVLSSESKLLWHAFRDVDLATNAWGRESEMHPYLSIGVRLARKWEPRLRWFTTRNSDLDINEEYPLRMWGHITRVIRRVCTSKSFARRIERLERQQRENFESCCKYFLSILRWDAKLLVLRADLYVKGQAKRAAWEGKIEQAVEKFIRNLREKRIIPGVQGYIVRREDAYDRGVHLHLMVIVDGDRHCKAYALTEMLKMYWIYQCVGSPELADGFNCYLRKDEYRYNAIGHVHYADEGALQGVRNAIEYLTRTDCHFLLPKSFGKNLRKGQAPRPPGSGKRRGAPRKFANDVSLAERILLGRGTGTHS